MDPEDTRRLTDNGEELLAPLCNKQADTRTHKVDLAHITLIESRQVRPHSTRWPMFCHLHAAQVHI